LRQAFGGRLIVAPDLPGRKEYDVSMFKIRAGLLSLLIVLAIGAIAASSASAVVQGPWWEKLEGGKQVKIEAKNHLQIKSRNEQGKVFILKSKALGLRIVLECRRVTNKGSVWSGPHTGRDEAKVEWNECFVAAQSQLCPGFPIEVAATNVLTELMWKYEGNQKELSEAGGGQKIYDVFAPNEVIEEVTINGQKVLRSKFTTIKIPTESGGKKCAAAGEFPVYAQGKRYQHWEDQKQPPAVHEVIWGTAALVEPQNEDKQVVKLVWTDPNVTKLHVQESPEEARLEFGVEPAELQGTIVTEAEEGLTEFGAWNT
jgi:hypothetical protein